MKTNDKIFITIMVIIICISGIIGVKMLPIPKAREVINVSGEGSVSVKPDQIKIHTRIREIRKGSENNPNQEKIEKELTELAKNSNYSIQINLNDKYCNEGRDECSIAYDIDFLGSGDNSIEQGKKIIKYIEKSTNIVDHYQTIAYVTESNKYVRQATEIALKNAKVKAEETAKTLGVKLGKLMQTSEIGFVTPEENGNNYNDYEPPITEQRFFNSYVDENTKITIFNKTYLSYEIN